MSSSLVATILFAVAFALLVIALTSKGNPRRRKVLQVVASVLCVLGAIFIFVGSFE